MSRQAPAGRRRESTTTAIAVLTALIAPFAAQAQGRANPEPPSASRPGAPATGGATARKAVIARKHMVVAANPYAVRAGLEILRAGGSAIDAAIATQLVLGLVEPQSSGIGGGAFIVHWNGAAKRLRTYDGRETTPMATDPAVFEPFAGSLKGFIRAAGSGASVGVPGLVRALKLAHERHGKLPWARLFEPAIGLAETGFAMSPRLNALLARYPDLRNDPGARAIYFAGDRTPHPPGTTIVNTAYAHTLRRLAKDGPRAFYEGALAASIVAAVRRPPLPAGQMTLADLKTYRAKERPPVCGSYRGYRICGMGPPSSGGIAVIQILGLLERFDLKALGPGTPTAAHLFAEAGAIAFADRNRYVADADFVPVPVKGLLARNYLAGRSTLIDRRRTGGRIAPGKPFGRRTDRWGDGVSPERPSTSHISIVDGQGNAVSMTTTIERAFGARRTVRGFFLNNQLTDFSFKTRRDGRPVANRVEPGKRPRSSMAPTIVFKPDGRLHLVIGSPGGSSIIGYVAWATIAVLDWGLDPQTAVSRGHVQSRNGGRVDLERGASAGALRGPLERLGHKIRIRPMTSGLHAIVVKDGKLIGGADPRREGIAVGD